MNGSDFVGRVGGLALALGIGAAIANGCAIAAADDARSSSAAGSQRPSAAATARPAAANRVNKASVVKPASRAGAARSPVLAGGATNNVALKVQQLSPRPHTVVAATPALSSASSALPVLRAPRSAPNSGAASATAGLTALLSGLASSTRQSRVAHFNATPTVTFNAAENVVNADGTISGRVHGLDADGDKLTYTVGRPVRGGTVAIDPNGNFVYTPVAGTQNAAYTDSFTVTVSDAASGGIHGLLGLFIKGWGSTATTTATVQKAATPVPSPTPTSAADKFGWGAPTASVDFTGQSSLSNWYVYDAAGNGGNGRRTPAAISFANNEMVITGDANGNTGGLMWQAGQRYGAWEVKMRVPVGAQDYNAVALLWPSTNRWPADGEIDFMELKNDATRHNVTAAVHYSPDGKTDTWVGGKIDVDATQWHNYAVVWTPTRITTYVDGVPYFSTTDVAKFPTTAMQLCLQLDYAGSNLAGGAKLEIADARMYSLAAVNAGTV